MKEILLVVLMLIVSSGALLWAISKFVEYSINLKILKEEEKHPGTYPRSDIGFCINRKTKEVEGGSKIILPFD